MIVWFTRKTFPKQSPAFLAPTFCWSMREREREIGLFYMHPSMARITLPTYTTSTSSYLALISQTQCVMLSQHFTLEWSSFLLKLKKKTWIDTLPFEDLKYIYQCRYVWRGGSQSRCQIVLFIVILCQCRFSDDYGTYVVEKLKYLDFDLVPCQLIASLLHCKVRVIK